MLEATEEEQFPRKELAEQIGRPNLGVVVNPAPLRIDLAFNGDLDFKAVTVHPPALMIVWSARQSLCRNLSLAAPA